MDIVMVAKSKLDSHGTTVVLSYLFAESASKRDVARWRKEIEIAEQRLDGRLQLPMSLYREMAMLSDEDVRQDLQRQVAKLKDTCERSWRARRVLLDMGLGDVLDQIDADAARE